MFNLFKKKKKASSKPSSYTIILEEKVVEKEKQIYTIKAGSQKEAEKKFLDYMLGEGGYAKHAQDIEMEKLIYYCRTVGSDSFSQNTVNSIMGKKYSRATLENTLAKYGIIKDNR